MRKLQLRTKLSLDQQTVRVLSDRQLADAEGGGNKSNYMGNCSYDADTRYTMYAGCSAGDACTASFGDYSCVC